MPTLGTHTLTAAHISIQSSKIALGKHFVCSFMKAMTPHPPTFTSPSCPSQRWMPAPCSSLKIWQKKHSAQMAEVSHSLRARRLGENILGITYDLIQLFRTEPGEQTKCTVTLKSTWYKALTFCSVHTREHKTQPSKHLHCQGHSCQSCRPSAQSRPSYLNCHLCPVICDIKP